MLLFKDFYIIQSAEILHDYHNAPLKNTSSMIMTAERRIYIQIMFVNIMCNMQACKYIFRKLSEWMAKIISKCAYYSIICCMFSTSYHKIGGGRLTICQRWWSVHFNILISSYQFTVVQRCPFSRALYWNLNLQPTTTLFPKVSRGPIVAHSQLLEFKTPHISKFLWSWVKQKSTKFNTNQFTVSFNTIIKCFVIAILRM